MKKKISSLLISMIMMLTLLAVALQIQVYAEGRPSLVSGIGGAIKNPSPITSDKGTTQFPQSYIYFGKDESGNGIKWRVLNSNKDNSGNTGAIFLLSERPLANNIKFHSGGNDWTSSNARQWCTSFIQNTNHFNSVEFNSVRPITKDDQAGEYFDSSFDESRLRNEKLFFLSVQELSYYVADHDFALTFFLGDSWWLRSPGIANAYYAGSVNNLGVVHFSSVDYDLSCHGALNINHESVIFTSAAVGGKLSNIEGVTGLQGVESTETKDWKLTLRDNDRAFNLNGDIEVNGRQIAVPYKDAMSGTNEYISAIIKDRNGNIIYYGRIMQLESNDQITDIVNIQLPEDFDKENHKLYILNEQCNGDKLTDYASRPIEINFDGIELLSQKYKGLRSR